MGNRTLLSFKSLWEPFRRTGVFYCRRNVILLFSPVFPWNDCFHDEFFFFFFVLFCLNASQLYVENNLKAWKDSVCRENFCIVNICFHGREQFVYIFIREENLLKKGGI